MSKKVTNRDWTELSTYLDGQLSQRRITRLEVRMKTNAELQQAYVHLRQTRQLMRRLPPLKAPRNFVLTPVMVAQPARPVFRWPQALAMTSALASLLFVLVFMSDFLILGSMGEMQVAYELAAEPDVQMLDTVAMASEDMLTEIVAYPSPSTTLPTFEADAAILTIGPDEQAVETPAQKQIEIEELLGEAPVARADEPGADEIIVQVEMWLGYPGPDDVVGLANDEATLDPNLAEDPERLEETLDQPETGNIPKFLWLELVLGGLILVSGILAFYLRRQGF